MAHVIGRAGGTSERVESERILAIDGVRAAIIATVGIGTGAVAWAAGLERVTGLLLAAYVGALVGVMWLFITALSVGSVIVAAARSHMHTVAAVADLALGIGTGAVYGAAARLPAPSDIRLWVGLGGALLASGAVGWRLRMASGATGRLAGGRVGEERVIRELRRLPKTYVVLVDVPLVGPEGRYEIDSLVLGPTGVYVIEVKHWTGIVRPGRDVWTQTTRRGEVSRPSPVQHLERARRAVARRLDIAEEQVTPILVLVGGRLAGPAPVRVESIGSLRGALTGASTVWPSRIPLSEAVHVFAPKR